MEVGESSHIDIQILSDSIQAKLYHTSNEMFQKCSIYRVPKLLRQGNENAYTPTAVSIGPYHHKDERLRSKECCKLEYLKSLLNRLEDGQELLNSILLAIIKKEREIRWSYADPINLSSEDFTQMVLIDSVFIIKFFRRRCYPRDYENRMLFGRVLGDEVSRDIMLIENQLPLFILKQVSEIINNHNNQVESNGEDVQSNNITVDAISSTEPVHEFMQTMHRFFDIKYLPTEGQSKSEETAECYHLLDFMRSTYLPNTENSESVFSEGCIASPTATSLHEAGIGFQVKLVDAEKPDRSNKGLLGIEFDVEKGILTIPKLRTEDSTQSVYKNMIALEQCVYLFDTTTHLTDYFYFLDCLINTPADVQLLADAGVVDNRLGNNVLCDMLNTISKNTRTAPWRYTYADVSQKLNDHCNKSWNRNKATLRNKYFTHPWAVISLFYAIILLILTLVQVTTGILAVPGVLKK